LATGGKPSLMVIILTDSLLSRFNKLNVPLYLHPGLPLKSVQQAYFTGFSAEVNARLSMFAWGWHHEAGIHLLRLMLSGAFDKYPNLQVISGHWGEMIGLCIPDIGWLVCRFAVCRIFPALKSQAGKPRANERPHFPSTLQTACGNESAPVSEMATPQ